MWKKILALCLVSLYLSGCTTVQEAPDESVQAQLKALQRQVEDQENEIAGLRQEINIAKEATVRSAPRVAKKTTSTVSMKGATAKNIQIALANAGYYYGNIDGKLGAKSTAAIKEFQRDNNLKGDGIVGAQTWDKLSEYLDIK